MSPTRRCPVEVVTGALLAAVVLGTALGAPGAQAGAGGQASVRFLEGPSEAMAAQQRRVREARRHRRLQRLRAERAAAHARMPSTMYASTPDGATPPHPFPLAVPPSLAVPSPLDAPSSLDARPVPSPAASERTHAM